MKHEQTEQSYVPMVSVIIPTYNYARFLAEAVDSALAQTYRPIEVLIVDDGSTDGTRELIETRYGNRAEIRYIFKENQGLSAARNTGIQGALGTFLVFLDADDRLRSDYVAKALEAYARLPSDTGVVAVQMEWIDTKGDLIPSRLHFPTIETEITSVDLLVMSRFSPAVMVRSEVFQSCGNFDVSLKASEDRDMWIRISRIYRIFRLADKLLEVRRHGENMSGNGHRQSACIRQVLLKAYRSGIISGWRQVYWVKALSIFVYQKALMESGDGKVLATLRIMLSILLWPVHLDARELGQSRCFFRARTAAWLIRRAESSSNNDKSR